MYSFGELIINGSTKYYINLGLSIAKSIFFIYEISFQYLIVEVVINQH
jgi:hypothetical protein